MDPNQREKDKYQRKVTRDLPEEEQLEKEESKKRHSDLYSKGYDILRSHRFRIEPDISSPFGFHRVYKLIHPYLDHINVPDEFYAWKEISTEAELSKLEEIIIRDMADVELGGCEELSKFFKPIVQGNKNCMGGIYEYVRKLYWVRDAEERENSGKPFYLGINPYPRSDITEEYGRRYAPYMYVPAKEWFPEQLHQLNIFDFLTIYPTTEAKLKALGIGRACVGPDNHYIDGVPKIVINHTSRMGFITIGEDPGMGKSILYNMIFDAMLNLGYRKDTFDSLDSQFNLGGVISSNIIYKDDMSIKTLKGTLTSERTKILITGKDKMKVQDKGKDAVNVRPIGVLFANSNHFSESLAWGIDAGVADRVKLLATHRLVELQTKRMEGLSAESPDLRPEYHLPWLAEKLGVDVQTIMFYFLRLCVDYFTDVIENGNLMTEVKNLSVDLRYNLDMNGMSQILNFLVYCAVFRNPSYRLYLNKNSVNGALPIEVIEWKKVLGDAAQVILTDVFYEVYNKLKEDFITKRDNGFLDETHPYLGAKNLDIDTFYNSVVKGSEVMVSSANLDNLGVLANYLTQMRLKGGLPLLTKSENLHFITSSYRKIAPATTSIIDLAVRDVRYFEDNNPDVLIELESIAKRDFTKQRHTYD
jgi:hypothetical protein